MKNKKNESSDIFDQIIEGVFRLADLIVIFIFKLLEFIGRFLFKKILKKKQSKAVDSGLSENAHKITKAHERISRGYKC